MSPTAYLRTGDVARVLGVTTDTVVREIRAGRLACARQIRRPSGRTAYRLTLDECCDYVRVWVREEGYAEELLAALAALVERRAA
jgi:hypothetical protein